MTEGENLMKKDKNFSEVAKILQSKSKKALLNLLIELASKI
jgi:hypothetical protein